MSAFKLLIKLPNSFQVYFLVLLAPSPKLLQSKVLSTSLSIQIDRIPCLIGSPLPHLAERISRKNNEPINLLFLYQPTKKKLIQDMYRN